MSACGESGHKTKLGLLPIFVAVLSLFPFSFVHAYTPEDPIVKELVDGGVKYLSKNWHSHFKKLGADTLCALAIYKATGNRDHPRIQAAVKSARAGVSQKFEEIYTPAIACILLCEVDPQNSKQHIGAYLKYIFDQQGAYGGWNYSRTDPLGDTSQSQYGTLAFWYAKNRKFNVPMAAAARCLNWFILGQERSGGWQYNPTAGTGAQSAGNLGVTNSLTAAGLGSVYVLTDLLGFKGLTERENDSSLPPDVRLVTENDDDRDNRVRRVVTPELKRCMMLGNQWFDRFFASKTDIGKHEYPYYYLYGLERYQSFREKFENRSDPSPAWYNGGVEFLRRERGSSGSWGGGNEIKTGVATAFAILFLTRSTKKSIVDFETKGQLVAVGPIRDTGKISRRGDRIVSESVTKSVTELLDAIENSSDDELGEVASAPLVINFTGDANVRAQQMSKLRKLMLNDDWKKRRLAVRTLARERELDNIPVLIYALSDPDTQVVDWARKGLRFISRKVNGITDVPEPPAKKFDDKEQTQETKESKAERLKWVELAQGEWKKWYRTIRPDAEFFSD